MAKWQDAPPVDQQQAPRWMQAEVVSEGGPRTLMSATLDRMDPQGAGRRAGTRAKEKRRLAELDRDRSFLRTVTSMTPSLQVVSGLLPDEQAQRLARLAPEQPRKMIGGFGTGVGDGGTFGFQDEIAGLVGGKDAKERLRSSLALSQEEAPVSTFAGQLTGGIASPVNKPLMAATGVKTVGTAARGVGQLAREGFRVGAAGGALYGAGSAEGGLRERGYGAAQGAIYGGLGGAVLGPAIGAVGNKLSTGQFFPGQSVLNMTAEDFTRSGAGRLINTALERSDVPRKDIPGAVTEAFNLFQMSGNQGNRPLTFAQALERTLEQRGYAQAAGNVKSIFQQLQASRAGQGMSQQLDNMAGSQEAYIASALDDTLGPTTLAKERARIRGEQRAIGDAQDDAISQARSMGGNEAGTPAIRQMIERAEMDPNPTVTSWLNRAARDMGFTQTGAAQGQKPVPAFRNAATGDPLGFAKQIVRTINAARTGGAQLDAVTINLLDEAQTALNAATRSTRGPGGRFGYNRLGSFNEGQQKFRLTYEELDGQAQKFIGLARDPLKRAEFSEAMYSAPDQVKLAVRTRLKEDIAAALKSGNVDEIMPYLGGVRQKGLHEDLVAFLGDDGERISRVIRDVLDEQSWIKSVDARRMSPADRTAIGRNADVKNIYTANPLARLANKTPLMTTLVGDVATGAITGTPALTAAKVIGHLTGPRGSSIRQLARTLAARRTQGGTNNGTLSRMPPTGAAGATGGATQAPQGSGAPMAAPNVPAPVRTSQRAPWSPAVVPEGAPPEIIPRVQTGAQRTADRARQRAINARQRAADAQARKADAETIRKTLADAKQAEADAKVAEIQARNAAQVTKAQLKAVADAARAKVRAAKSAGVTDKKLTAREAAAAAAKRDAEEGLDSALDRERRMKAVAKDEVAAQRDRAMADRVRIGTDDRVETYTRAQGIEVAKANASGDVDPVRTFEETGHLAMTIGNDPIVILDIGAKNGDDLVRMLSRVEDDLLGANRDKPEKWSQLTIRLRQIAGEEKLIEEIRKGVTPGWRTPQERINYERGQKLAKTTIGALGVAVAGAGANEGYRRYDQGQQAQRAKRIMESPELTKVVQRALKATRHYGGRADGRHDDDVQIAIAQFQGTYGLGKSSDPGSLDTATLKKLEEMLIFEGKTKLANEIRDIRRNKLKAKEK